MDAERAAQIEEILGAPVTERPAELGGYSHAFRRIVQTSDGRSAFAKGAVDDDTARWLRNERRIYQALEGAPFLAQVLGWRGGERPMLVLEDLSGAYWPPPWRPGDVDAVLAALARLAAAPTDGLEDLHRLGDDANFRESWLRIGEDPAAFLGLGLVTPGWLEAALPALIDAQSEAQMAGDSLLLCDVRSDNLCLRRTGGQPRATLIDWNWTSIGDPRFDVAFWLPSLAAEGGPLPESVLPDAPEYAALVSGFFAKYAGLPDIPAVPRVRWIQKLQLSTALPWAVRALGLPPLDGPVAPGDLVDPNG